jgi:hypothetical protein
MITCKLPKVKINWDNFTQDKQNVSFFKSWWETKKRGVTSGGIEINIVVIYLVLYTLSL